MHVCPQTSAGRPHLWSCYWRRADLISELLQMYSNIDSRFRCKKQSYSCFSLSSSACFLCFSRPRCFWLGGCLPECILRIVLVLWKSSDPTFDPVRTLPAPGVRRGPHIPWEPRGVIGIRSEALPLKALINISAEHQRNWRSHFSIPNFPSDGRLEMIHISFHQNQGPGSG